MRFAPAALIATATILCATPAVAADPPTVAVLYFDYDGKDGELTQLKMGLAQMLISDLSGNTFIRVVERERLNAVLDELKLQQSSKIDQATAVKAGKLLGAKYLVLGAYFDVMKTLRVDARVVEVETGKIVLSVGATGKPDDFLAIEQKLAKDLGKHFSSALPPPPPPKRNAPKRAAPPKPPDALKMRTMVEYSAALAMLDAGNKEKAKEGLRKVIAAQPDFRLAKADLDKMMK